jgi:Spy/CpxP family protein refolding chaperone
MMGSAALFLAAGWLMAQDTKGTSDDTPATPTKVKGALPTYFKSLGLTEEQRQKAIRIHATYKAKIESLTEQLAQARSEERAELNKILDDKQKIHLRELRSKETEPIKDTTPKDKPADAKTDAKPKDNK